MKPETLIALALVLAIAIAAVAILGACQMPLR
jgi:hypothetical protein